VVDEIGREAISRADAANLIAEHRDDENRRARLRAEIERRAIEADERMRATIWRGVPASKLPPDVRPVEVMTQAARDEQPRRRSLLDHALGHPDGAIVYHQLGSDGDES
jgi:hypothetical protein